MKIKTICFECYKIIIRDHWKLKQHTKSFCSRSCLCKYTKPGQGKKGKHHKINKQIFIKCIICNQSFKIRPYRKNIAKFCSRKCKGIFHSRTFCGSQHPRWVGGKNYLYDKIRHSSLYINWRNLVYIKDNWTCQLCNKHCHNDIIAHHIKFFKPYPKLRFNVKNGITLCRKCHLKLHRAEYARRKYKES